MIDPVYTATAVACLMDLIKKEEFDRDQNIVFLHTGGAVALYPYKEPIRSYLKEGKIPWKIPEWSPGR